MARAKKTAPVLTPAGHKGELMKLMRQVAHKHDLWRVFSDFVEMAAVSIANAVDRRNPDAQAREARYLEIAKAYTRDELETFAHMLGHLTMALELAPGDVLGEVFMELELGSKWHGQFFTPYHVCRLMAAINIGSPEAMRAQVEAQGFVTVNEPACGGGAMLIAMAEEMRAAGINYQQHMHCTAQDIDIKSVHMCYVQLSLLYVPAYVIHGNSLALEERSVWCTPAHVMGGWAWKLRRRQSMQAEAETHEQAEQLPKMEPATTELPAAPEQALVVAPQSPPPQTAWQQTALF